MRAPTPDLLPLFPPIGLGLFFWSIISHFPHPSLYTPEHYRESGGVARRGCGGCRRVITCPDMGRMVGVVGGGGIMQKYPVLMMPPKLGKVGVCIDEEGGPFQRPAIYELHPRHRYARTWHSRVRSPEVGTGLAQALSQR